MSAVEDHDEKPAQPGELGWLRDYLEFTRELLTASGRDLAVDLLSLADAVDEYDTAYGAHDASLCADCGVDTTPRDPGAPCADCGVDTTPRDPRAPWEDYMVRDDLWRHATNELPARYLCIGCLEYRIGRQLVAADFIHAPINNAGDEGKSERLLSRLRDHSPEAQGATP